MVIKKKRINTDTEVVTIKLKDESRILRSLLLAGLSCTAYVFITLAVIGEGVFSAFFNPHPFAKPARALFSSSGSAPGATIQFSRGEIDAALRRLKRRGLVKQKSGGGLYYLTAKGKRIFEKYRDRRVALNKAWDGKWRLVSFDIPENRKQYRNWLRAELISLGFQPLHKSVFVSKHCLPESFVKDLYDLGLRKYIKIMLVTQID